jgi:hypothetical protein
MVTARYQERGNFFYGCSSLKQDPGLSPLKFHNGKGMGSTPRPDMHLNTHYRSEKEGSADGDPMTSRVHKSGERQERLKCLPFSLKLPNVSATIN